MEYEKIKELINDMQNSKLTSMDIDFPDGTKISMKKEASKEIASISNNKLENYQIVNSETINNRINKQVIPETVEEGNIVKSPMVGTFYIKSSPTSMPYVEIGKTVKKNDTLCIIEAMKLMNEIESEFDGQIAQIYVKDGDTVEYGTPLFKIK